MNTPPINDMRKVIVPTTEIKLFFQVSWLGGIGFFEHKKNVEGKKYVERALRVRALLPASAMVGKTSLRRIAPTQKLLRNFSFPILFCSFVYYSTYQSL